MPSKTVGHDFGLLHALDERTAMYGWVTNTGVKLVIVVDMEGRPASTTGPGKAAVLGLKDRDLTPVRVALATGGRVYTADTYFLTGFSSTANSLHTPTTQPFLHP